MGTLNARLRTILLAAALLVAFGLGFALRGGGGGGGAGDPGEMAAEESAATIWTCSMHPQIQLPEPGQCPICGMDLIPLESEAEDSGNAPVLNLTERAAALAEIRTAPVRRQRVTREVRTVGKLEADETRVREITARVAGRIDTLHVDYTGEHVDKGERLFDVYSPELYSAQEELLQALRARAELEKSDLASTRLSAERTLEAVRERLRLWGLTPDQIAAIEERGRATDHIAIVAPMAGTVMHKAAVEGTYVQTGTHIYSIADLANLWLKLDAYESDLAWIRVGQTVRFETDSYPGETFEGTVSFVDPMLTERTRTVKVRVGVPNPDGRLLPGMFVRAVLRAEIRGNGEPPLVIPASAPLLTGTRAVVYVADPGKEGRFLGREITLGPRAGEFYVVRSGLEEGERVVTNGAFKIDSALQILAKPSMMSPEGGGPAPGHDHGAHGAEPSAGSGDSMEEEEATGPFAAVPAGFRSGVDALLGHYYAVGKALSHDDAKAAREAAGRLADSVGKVDSSGLPADAADAWERIAAALSGRAKSLAAASDIAAARDEFFHVSRRMIETVRRFGATGEVPAMVFHCPMARENAGADWLQPAGGTENPYYGSMMFKCGSARDTLVAGSDDAAADAGHAGH
jgi:Cu(I)/Ag(I) efflux system membrane fusion protein